MLRIRSGLLLAGTATAVLSANGTRPLFAQAGGERTIVRRLDTKFYEGVPAFIAAPSPNGRSVVVLHAETGDLELRDLATGNVRLLTHNTAPYKEGMTIEARYSRDGKRVAYNWLRLNESARGPFNDIELRIVDTAGSSPTIVYDPSPSLYVRALSWSPDGATILAARVVEDGTSQLVLIPTGGGTPRVLKSFDWREPNAVFSPDGRYVLYDHPPGDDSNDRDVYLMDLAGQRETRLVSGPGNDFIMGWSPDGGQVLFGSDRSGTPGAWLLAVANGKAQGEPVLVKRDLWRATPVGFLADGSFMYAVETGTRGVYIATLDPHTGNATGTPIRITQETLGRDTRVGWSADGRSISYSIKPDNNTRQTIAIRSLETGAVRLFPVPATMGQYVQDQRWLPDGSALLMRASEKGRIAMVRMDVQTGRFETVFKVPSAEDDIAGFDLTPDGRSIVYRYEHTGPNRAVESRIIVRDRVSGVERVIYSAPEGGTNRLNKIAVSHDNRWVAFTRRSAQAEKSFDLVIAPLAGGEPKKISSAPDSAYIRGFQWTPDDRALLTFKVVPPTRNAMTAVFRVSVETGVEQPIGLAMAGLTQLRMEPRGSRLAFSGGSGSSELWVMSGLLPSKSADKSP
jgi:Tol biopolymer transport system component